jgi:OmcA/MtrC family decaheme c-type cytochrome
MPLSPSDEGTFTVGIEACLAVGPSTLCAENPVANFAVTDPAPKPRRVVVERERCNACHDDLAFHSLDARQSTSYCVMCHHAAAVRNAPLAEASSAEAPPMAFKELIHGLHAEVAYPSPRSHCSTCHADGTTALPLPSGLLPTRSETRACTEPPDADTNSTCATFSTTTHLVPPVSSACAHCHSSMAAQAHAALNSTPSGAEACAVCHGAGRSADLAEAHRSTP